jgi:hypothetical protein
VGLMALTTLLAEGAIEARYRAGPPELARYLQPEGVVLQCSGCRRVHVAGTRPRAWEIVPALVASPSRNVSYTICELCLERYYGSLPRPPAPGTS